MRFSGGAGCRTKIVVFFLRSEEEPQLSPWLRYHSHIHPAIHRVQDMLMLHPKQPWSLEEIASHAPVSARLLRACAASNSALAWVLIINSCV
ncbi:transcriptional regulator [Erwinia amylovora Ea644]|nr:transcriptional regulator [Erwinia amylovora Ea644]